MSSNPEKEMSIQTQEADKTQIHMTREKSLNYILYIHYSYDVKKYNRDTYIHTQY